MAKSGSLGAIVLIFSLLAFTGCMQPDRTVALVTVSTVVNTTSVPVVIPCQMLTLHPDATSLHVTMPATSGPAGVATLHTLPLKTPEPQGFARYSGADYSIDYPAAWSTNISRIPLREYRHTQFGCTVAPAYNLDQELRMFYSHDGSALFYSSIVTTERDIWPRNMNGQVVYEDIVNSILGNPDLCANTPEGAFTIAGISQVSLDGVSFTGIRADFGKINATGFTDGTGTTYVVNGKNRKGVFTFYRTSVDAGTQLALEKYIFGSLRLDPGF